MVSHEIRTPYPLLKRSPKIDSSLCVHGLDDEGYKTGFLQRDFVLYSNDKKIILWFMLMICPQCGSEHYVKNGHTYYRKQRFKCKDCGRQYVEGSQYQHSSEETWELVVREAERSSLDFFLRKFHYPVFLESQEFLCDIFKNT
ncbi:hypothetical protein CKA32_001467 [Geitlerinema sp. FC II]|nr:hypothetical protein CKA32_001467 [Geitlerinema sp. FC II]